MRGEDETSAGAIQDLGGPRFLGSGGGENSSQAMQLFVYRLVIEAYNSYWASSRITLLGKSSQKVVAIQKGHLLQPWDVEKVWSCSRPETLGETLVCKREALH